MQQQHTMSTGIACLFLCESAREISGVRTIRPRLQQKGGSGQANSFFLWPIVLPQFENTLQLFHPQLYTKRNRKCLHHRLHPSSPAKRPVTFIDFWLSLLSTSNMTDSHHYSWQYEHCLDNLLLLHWCFQALLFSLISLYFLFSTAVNWASWFESDMTRVWIWHNVSSPSRAQTGNPAQIGLILLIAPSPSSRQTLIAINEVSDTKANSISLDQFSHQGSRSCPQLIGP